MDQKETKELDQASRILSSALGTTIASMAESLQRHPQLISRVLSVHSNCREEMADIAKQLSSSGKPRKKGTSKTDNPPEK